MNLETRQSRAAGGAWILEQLSLDNPDVERNAARRAMNETVRAWPGDTQRLWWKWFSEAATSLGLRSKTFDCTVDEAINLATEGAQLICYREEEATEWLAIFDYHNQKFKTAVANEGVETDRLKRRSLRKLIMKFAKDDSVRCVIVQQHEIASSAAGSNPLPPFERLKQILRPEWSDIWLVLIFAFVVGMLALATPIAVETLVNTVAFGRFLQPIVVLALILLTFLGFAAALRGLQSYVVEIVQRRLFARVAGDLGYRLPRAEMEAMDDKFMPELVNRFFDIVTVQKVSAKLLLDGVSLVLGTVIGMAVLGFYHPWLLGFDLVLLAAIAIIVFVLGRGAVPSAIKESKSKYKMAAWLEDVARCPATFRNDAGTKFAMERTDHLVEDYLNARQKHFRVLFRQILFALGLQAVASTVLLGLGGWLVIDKQLTLGQLVAAELIVTTIVGAFAKIGKHLESFYDLLASIDKIGNLIDLPTEREDGMLASTTSGPVDLELNALSYGFAKRGSVLNKVTGIVGDGSSLAVYGGSGSGKSVLMDLIYGTRIPGSGHLKIDGFDPRDLRPDVLRSRVALVRDETFAGTIEDNVHLHREEVSSGDVRDVLSELGLLDTIVTFEDGLQTHLASSGIPLTENQRKLLAFARAIVGQPGLILVDGLLDGLPDDELERACEVLLNDDSRTVVVATGRRDIADRFDNILALNQLQST